MAKSRADKKLTKAIKSRFDRKQNELQRTPATMGNGAGNLIPSDLDGYVYVVIGSKSQPVYNNRVAPVYGLKVWVGYSAEEPTLYQVLSTRSETPGGSQTGFVGYAPAKRYEWMAVGGGQDPLHVHIRAMSHLKIGTSALGGMMVDLMRGFVEAPGGFVYVERQTLDMTAHIPTGTDLAAFVLVTIDNSGAVVPTKGGEVNIYALDAETHQPTKPSNTAFTCGMVRVYNGQTAVHDGRVNTDFVDLRFGGAGSGSGSLSFVGITEELTAQIDGTETHFDTALSMFAPPAVTCNVRQRPSEVTRDDDGLGFTLSFAPTTDDHLIVDYQATNINFIVDDEGNALHDDSGRILVME